MPSGPLGPGRGTLYDRSYSRQALTFANTGVAPHASTVRGTYTVPAGSLALVRYAGLQIVRQTAAAPVGLAIAYADLATSYLINDIALQLNGVGDNVRQLLTGELSLAAGEALRLVTSDASTGGTLFLAAWAGAQEIVI